MITRSRLGWGFPLTHDGSRGAVTVHGVTRLDSPAMRYDLFACGEWEEVPQPCAPVTG